MIIAIANHKGGTGKTTTAINLASALEKKGYSTLLVDIDPQANLTYSLGVTNTDVTIADLMGGEDLFSGMVRVGNVELIPSGINLYNKEEGLLQEKQRFFLLKNVLKNCEHDFIIIDCPPSFSFYTLNVLCATDEIIIPMNLDVLSLQGLNQMIDLTKEIRDEANDKLNIAGVLCVNVDERKQLTKEVLTILQNLDVPLFESYIRTNVKAAEAPSFGMSVIDYAPDSNSSKDYQAFCDELLETLSERTKTISYEYTN